MKSLALLSLASLLAPSLAFNFGKPPPKPPKVTMAGNFPWRDPFVPTGNISAFRPSCEASETFTATEYTLHDLMEMPPKGLWHWGDGLKKVFSGREYPGGWAGLDRHLHARSLLMMEYGDVPSRVRDWIEEQLRGDKDTKWLFALFDKPKESDEKVEETVSLKEGETLERTLDADRVLIFAPGALYSILPLWVAEDSKCKDALGDLARYSPEIKEDGVVAWPVDRKRPNFQAGERAMHFTIKAQVLRKATEAEIQEARAKLPAEPESAKENAKTDAKTETKAAPPKEAKEAPKVAQPGKDEL